MYSVLAVGGILFWILIAAELIYLYFCMGLEKTKGSNATASLIGLVVLLFCFSDLRTWLFAHTAWGTLGYIVGGVAVYGLLGAYWSIRWMWPRWGKKRKQIHKKNLTEWLEKQGVRGDQCPDDLKRELNLVVFGNYDQAEIESHLNSAWINFLRATGRSVNLNRTSDGIPLMREFVGLCVHQDPETIENYMLRQDIAALRKEWLKTQNVGRAELGIVIPERLLARFTERVTTPYVMREGNRAWAEVATEPLYRNNKARLLTWWAWWPMSLIRYAINDLLLDVGAAIMRLFESFGQRLMHKQYKDVRADFEIVEDEPAPESAFSQINDETSAALKETASQK